MTERHWRTRTFERAARNLERTLTPRALDSKLDAFTKDGRYQSPSRATAAPTALDPRLLPKDPERRGFSNLSFAMLSTFAEIFPPAAICIAKVQEQVLGIGLDFVALPGVDPKKAEVEKQRLAAKEYFGRRGGLGGRTVTWREWVKRLLWDALALDAVAIWKERDGSGKVVSHRLIEGNTIQPLLDEKGWVPEPPANAYEQYIGGQVKGLYTIDDLLYFRLNPRNKTPFGFPPCEAILCQILAWLHAETWNLDFFTSGDTTEGYWRVPNEWTPDQIQDFYAFITNIKAAFDANRQQAGWVPAGPEFMERRRRSDMEWDDLQMRALTLTAAMFNMNPSVLGFAGETYKVAQEGQMKAARQWGLVPILTGLKEINDEVLDDIGLDLIESQWAPEEQDRNKLASAIRQVGPERASINDGRRMLSMDPVESDIADCLYTVTQGGDIVVLHDPSRPGEVYRIKVTSDPVLPVGLPGQGVLEDADEAAGGNGAVPPPGLPPGAPPPALPAHEDDATTDETPPPPRQEARGVFVALDGSARKDLGRWRAKALRSVEGGGHAVVPFVTESIPANVQAFVVQSLQGAADAETVKKVFRSAQQMPVAFVGIRESLDTVRALVRCASGAHATFDEVAGGLDGRDATEHSVVE